MGIHLVIHMDPVDTENEETNFHLKKCTALLNSLDPSISLHDFRMVPGHTHTNIIFDVEVPFESKETSLTIKEYFENAYRNESQKYFFVIEFDRPQS